MATRIVAPGGAPTHPQGVVLALTGKRRHSSAFSGSKLIQFPARPLPDDQQEVVSRLESVLAMAKAGELDGIIIVARNREGVHNCGSSGCYAREQAAAFVPALLSVIDLCGGAA